MRISDWSSDVCSSDLDLTVGGRDSDELAVTGTVALGLDFGGADAYDGWTRFELEAGRREIVGGALGATVASFKDGDPFTLIPAERQSGWVGRLRGMAGHSAFQVGVRNTVVCGESGSVRVPIGGRRLL